MGSSVAMKSQPTWRSCCQVLLSAYVQDGAIITAFGGGSGNCCSTGATHELLQMLAAAAAPAAKGATVRCVVHLVAATKQGGVVDV
jgi:hypothetical protein